MGSASVFSVTGNSLYGNGTGDVGIYVGAGAGTGTINGNIVTSYATPISNNSASVGAINWPIKGLTDFSATGGTSQVVQQTTSGGAFTVGQLSASNVSDYSTGTWTPADGSGASLSLTVNNANYVKIGKLVVVTAYITYPATASGSTAVISGLPYTSNGVAVTSITSNSNLVVPINGDVGNGSTTITIVNAANVGAVTNANLSGKVLLFSLSYVSS
jgi:hypothetical protein